MLMPIVLAFGSVALFSFALLRVAFSEDRRVRHVLSNLSDYVVAQAGAAEPLIQPFRDRILRPAAVRVLDLARGLGPVGLRESMRRQLQTAGVLRKVRTEEFLVIKFCTALGGVVLGGLGALFWHPSLRGGVFLVLGSGALAFFAPDAWLSHKISQRKHLIRRSLPDMLDMLTISVEAGMGFDAALAKLVSRSSGPLVEEFAHTLQQIQAGISRREALRGLADRTDVPDLRTFVMAILQADVLGIGINSILRSQSKEMRLKRRQHAEEVAQKAPVKMVFPVVLCIFPATLLVIAGPAVISISRTFGYILHGGG
ncbi:MAG: type II secretion system F family protein [Actinobacteria bacterium]|nr:MAG: type II secretion system F family protein [Actinomycetota bacterium]